MSTPMTAGPPPWAVWLLRTLLPRRHREVLAADVLERYRTEVVPARGRAHADRWFLARVVEQAWVESRPAGAVVVLSFFLADGIYPGLPAPGATARGWLIATAPACVLAALGVRSGWRSGAWAATIVGLFASCVGTVAFLTVTAALLAFAQPQLMKIGMSWESARDLASVLRRAVAAGTVLSAIGGVIGARLHR